MILKIDKNDNIRIDKYLSENLSKSRSQITKMINNGLIKVNNDNIKSSYLLKENDLIDIQEIKEEKKLKPQNIPLDIYYEDEHLMVINKQSGLIVHPGSGNFENTLVSALMFYTQDLSDVDGENRLGIVHRLDKDTSGLMIIAKSNECHELLKNDFKNKKIKREYIALLSGIFNHNSAKINAPIGRNKQKRKEYIVTEENSKEAITNLTVIKRYQRNTLVRLALETGRTHQIRVHMKYIGFPVYNDPIYNNSKSDDFGQFLHSEHLEFIHPITKKTMNFNAPLPKKMKLYIDNLE